MRAPLDSTEIAFEAINKPKRPQSGKPGVMMNNYQMNNQIEEQYDDSTDNNQQAFIPQRQQQNQYLPPAIPRNPINQRQQSGKLNTSGQNNNDLSGVSDFSRLIPKSIPIEKEKLYAETLKLKNQNNTLNQENIRLRTKISIIEREYSKLEKQVDDNEQGGNYKGQFKGGIQQESSHLLNNLKKQLKDSLNNLSKRTEELEAIKKQIKYTRLQEMEIEKKTYQDETVRLKKLLEQTLKQKMQVMIQESDYNQLEEKCYMQQEIIQQLQREKGELNSLLNKFQEENFQIKQQLENYEKKYARENQNLRLQVKQRDKIILQLKQGGTGVVYQNQTQGNNNKIRPQTSQRPGSTKTNQPNTRVGTTQNQNKQNQIQKQNNQVQPVNISHGQNVSKIQQDNQQKNIVEDQIQQQNLKNSNQNSKQYQYQNQEIQINSEQKNKNEGDQQTYDPDEQQYDENEDQNQEQNDENEEDLRQPVLFEEVKIIGQDIKYRLMAYNFDWEELVNSVFPDMNSTTSLQDIFQILMSEPFLVTTEEDGIMLARYLIQNENDNAKFDPNMEQQNKIIVQKFTKVVGKFKIWGKEESEQLYFQISDTLDKYQATIKQTFAMKSQDNRTITDEQLKEVFQMLKIQVSDDFLQFMIAGIILDSAGVKQLEYEKFFEIFQKEEDQNQEYENNDDYDDYDYNQQYQGQEGNQHNNDQREDRNSDESEIIKKYDSAQKEPQNPVDQFLKNNKQELLESWQDSADFDDQGNTKKVQKSNNKNVKQKVQKPVQKQENDDEDYQEYDQEFQNDEFENESNNQQKNQVNQKNNEDYQEEEQNDSYEQDDDQIY